MRKIGPEVTRKAVAGSSLFPLSVTPAGWESTRRQAYEPTLRQFQRASQTLLLVKAAYSTFRATVSERLAAQAKRRFVRSADRFVADPSTDPDAVRHSSKTRGAPSRQLIVEAQDPTRPDRKSTRLNSSHG